MTETPASTLGRLKGLYIDRDKIRWVIQYADPENGLYIATSMQFGTRVYTCLRETGSLIEHGAPGIFRSAQLLDDSMDGLRDVGRQIPDITNWKRVRVEILPPPLGRMEITESNATSAARRKVTRRITPPTPALSPPTLASPKPKPVPMLRRIIESTSKESEHGPVYPTRPRHARRK